MEKNNQCGPSTSVEIYTTSLTSAFLPLDWSLSILLTLSYSKKFELQKKMKNQEIKKVFKLKEIMWFYLCLHI